MTNFDPFQYTFRSYDMPDLEDESKDLFDAKDKQLENELNFNIKPEMEDARNDISNLQTNFANLLTSTIPWNYIRVGTAVATLPAVGGFTTVTYSLLGVNDINIQSAFTSLIAWKGISITVSNGDPAANLANLGCLGIGLTGFRVYHLSNGNVGNLFRVNFHAIGYA